MMTLGHLRIQSGDALILSAAYRALESSGCDGVSEAGMLRFRTILDEIRALGQFNPQLTNDQWGVAL